MPDVGVFFKFRVAPQSDPQIETIMQDIFDVMAIEEYPSGDVKTYTLYRDPKAAGQWYMFELFTEKGSVNHATGPLIYKPGMAQQALLIEPHERTLLDPVIVHGCGEPIPGAPPQSKRDRSTDIGAIYTFKVAPENDAKVEQIMRDIFDAMAVEEYPTGNVITYTLFRDPSELGKWAMFEHFTAQGAADHARGPRIFKKGTEQLQYLVEPYFRVELEPVIVHGCGEPIPGVPATAA